MVITHIIRELASRHGVLFFFAGLTHLCWFFYLCFLYCSPKKSVPPSTSPTTFRPRRKPKSARKTSGAKRPRWPLADSAGPSTFLFPFLLVGREKICHPASFFLGTISKRLMEWNAAIATVSKTATWLVSFLSVEKWTETTKL